MSDPLAGTTTSLQALTEQYRTIAHNLANVNTAGYKRYTTTFTQELTGQLRAVNSTGAPASDRVVSDTRVDFTQGALTATGRPLDLAIVGEGFFVLETPEGPLYTRDGSFRVNAQGQLVNADGNLVAGDSGPIVIPETNRVHVAADGSVSVPGGLVGKIRIANFEEYGQLIPCGSGSYRAPASLSPVAPEEVTIRQAYQESSNVSVVDELVSLIAVTRMYEANIRSVMAQDERMENILDVAMA